MHAVRNLNQSMRNMKQKRPGCQSRYKCGLDDKDISRKVDRPNAHLSDPAHSMGIFWGHLWSLFLLFFWRSINELARWIPGIPFGAVDNSLDHISCSHRVLKAIRLCKCISAEVQDTCATLSKGGEGREGPWGLFNDRRRGATDDLALALEKGVTSLDRDEMPT